MDWCNTSGAMMWMSKGVSKGVRKGNGERKRINSKSYSSEMAW